MNLTTSTQQTPPGPDPATSERDPMRNASSTLAAYLLFFGALAALLAHSWRRQRALEARLGDVERSLDKAGPPRRDPAQPLVRVAGHD